MARLRSAFYHLVDPEHAIGAETNKFQQNRAELRKNYGNNYVAFLADRAYAKFDIAHFYPQTTWTHSEGRPLVEFMGRLEKMDDEWGRLSEALGVTLPKLERKNPTVNRAYEKAGDLPDAAVSAAKEFYIRDYVYLGYE